jgi:phosphoglycolate phosphatase
MYLVLFDIDGTLLTCGPQVRPIFASALAEVYGREPLLDGYDFSGRTDPGIVVDLVARVGIDEGEALARLPLMHEVYLDRLEAGLDGSRMRVFPGVVETLEELAARPDVEVGLLTGNWRRGAAIKLSRVGLGHHFAFGGFGDDGRRRRELVPAALQRARETTGIEFSPERVLVVGDSPLDVDCARHHGIATLAVATGWTPAEELRAAGAEWVVPSLDVGFATSFAEFRG